MSMLTISDVKEFQSDILEFGIQDFDEMFTKTEADILRRLHIDWWVVRSQKQPVVPVTSTNSDFDENKLDKTQFTRAAVFYCLGYYIYPMLSSFQPEGDKFQELMKYYREEFEREFELCLRRGVRYDDDGDSTYETSEKQPVHFGRLIR